MRIKELEQRIKEANESYRNGESIVSDQQYDLLMEELLVLDPNNILLSIVGGEHIDSDRKDKLPIPMFSMNKVKTIDELMKWAKSKNIPLSSYIIVEPKYDGCSLCVSEAGRSAWTRGDGVIGQKSDGHFKSMNTNNIDENIFTFGEAIMKRDVFINKYSDEWSNARNLVGGKLNDKTPTDILNDVDYVRYGLVGEDFATKKEMLDYLNERQQHKVEYKVFLLSELTEEILKELFFEWNKVYEIDGIIIEVNDLFIWNKLGRDNNNNPIGSIAFKSPSFTESKETIIESITWEISKNFLLKPVMNIKPIEIDGIKISRCTGNNARFMAINNLGINSVVKILRSGGVIPKLVEVIHATGFQLPVIEGVEIGWNENGVELIALTETDDQKIKQLISFFEILEVDNVGEGVISQLWDHGYKTIHDILKLTPDVLSELEGFGKRKSVIVYNSIQKRVKDIPLSKLQHATGFFTGLGEKKLILLEHFETKPTIEEIVKIEGFAKKSAESYLEGLDKFYEFISDLPVTILKTEKVEKLSDSMEGMVFVFTGVRDKSAEESILKMGGKIGSSVSKLTTHLVCKDPNSGSSKLEKAMSLGVKVISIEELHELFLNQSV